MLTSTDRSALVAALLDRRKATAAAIAAESDAYRALRDAIRPDVTEIRPWGITLHNTRTGETLTVPRVAATEATS